MKLNGYDSAPNSSRSHGELDPRVDQIQNENRRLQNDLKELNEKLHKTEIELEKVKRVGSATTTSTPTNSDFQKREHSAPVKRATPEDDKITVIYKSIIKVSGHVSRIFSNFFKAEIQKLRDDFKQILEKYSNLEYSNQELNASLHSLKNRALNNQNDFITTRREPIDLAA